MLKLLSVSELSSYISGIFDAEELLHHVEVYGEVSGLSVVRGNAYFCIKDENSILSCIMFGAPSINFKDGDQIIARGGLKYYAKGGKLNLYVNATAPYGSGILFKNFIELKNRLELEGVFDIKHKKPLPNNIQKIGVITSKTGAVLHDIETVSHRRNPTLDIVVYPTRVQGEGADLEIIRGLEYFADKSDIDVIIIARGGGSIEDLQPFNSERLARKIIEIDKMIISAVGHETDFTICDFASSFRCATPSEAAEIVSNNVIETYKTIEKKLDKVYMLLCSKIDESYSKIDKKYFSLRLMFSKMVALNENNLCFYSRKLDKIDFLEKRQNDIDILYNKLLILNPKRNAKNGWARISSAGNLIKTIDDISIEDDIDIELIDGKFRAKVTTKGCD